MGKLPAWVLGHTVTIEAYQGVNFTGDVYGSPVDHPSFVESKPKQVLNQRAEEVVSTATVYLQKGAATAPGDRYTLPDGRISHAIQVYYRDGGGLPTPDHIEVAVQ